MLPPGKLSWKIQHSWCYMKKMNPFKSIILKGKLSTHLTDIDCHILLFICSVAQSQPQLLLAVESTQLHFLCRSQGKYNICKQKQERVYSHECQAPRCFELNAIVCMLTMIMLTCRQFTVFTITMNVLHGNPFFSC